MIIQNEVEILSDFIKAINQNRKMYPESFTRQEWKQLFWDKIKAFSVGYCNECDFMGGCGGCRGTENGQLAKYRDEILDIAVVTYQFWQQMDKLIIDWEKQLVKAAMDHDPR